MPKFYAECSYRQRITVDTENHLAACVVLVGLILTDVTEENFELSPFIVVSEAGFDEHIKKWGTQEMSEEQYMFSTSSVLRFMQLDEIADSLDQWCIDQRNPILMQTLRQVKEVENNIE